MVGSNTSRLLPHQSADTGRATTSGQLHQRIFFSASVVENSILFKMRISLAPNTAWLLVFAAAFFYYMSTRLFSFGLFRSSSIGDPFSYEIVDSTQCSSLSEILPIDCRRPTTKTSSGPLYRILQEPHTVATTWKHDSELGRGYLLLSTSLGKGKVWQWETGGGPIPIGRTLHLQDSGCRSKPSTECGLGDDSGSGGLVVDVWHDPPRLIVAEWGERRVVRLEPESGARTPLVVHHYQEGYPVQAPQQLLLTAFGDLIILDSRTTTTTSASTNEEEESESVKTTHILWQLPQVSTIPPLASLAESRDAHSWSSLPPASNHTVIPQLVLEQSRIGGVTLVPNEWLELYVTMSIGEKQTAVLGILSLGDDDTPRQSRILMDYSQYARVPGPVTVDEAGRLYLAVDSGLLVVHPPNKIVGIIRMPSITDPIMSLTMGEDRFLYIATKIALYRMKTRVKPLEMPTNLVIRK